MAPSSPSQLQSLSLETAPDKLNGALGSCFGKLHKHPPEKQKSNLKTLLFFFFGISRSPFYSPTSPFLLPLFQISSEDRENTFGFRLGFGLLGSLPLGRCSTPPWQLSPQHTPISAPQALLWATLRAPATQPKMGGGEQGQFWGNKPFSGLNSGFWSQCDNVCGPVWASPCSSPGLSFPLGNEGEHCVRKALALLRNTLGRLRQKEEQGRQRALILTPHPSC